MNKKIIFDYSCYHGPISTLQADQILQKSIDDNHSEDKPLVKVLFLIRSLENGSFSLLAKCVGKYSKNEEPKEFFIDPSLRAECCIFNTPYVFCKTCSNFNSLKMFISVKRKNPLSLEELAKCAVLKLEFDYESQLPWVMKPEMKALKDNQNKIPPVQEDELSLVFHTKMCQFLNSEFFDMDPTRNEVSHA